MQPPLSASTRKLQRDLDKNQARLLAYRPSNIRPFKEDLDVITWYALSVVIVAVGIFLAALFGFLDDWISEQSRQDSLGISRFMVGMLGGGMAFVVLGVLGGLVGNACGFLLNTWPGRVLNASQAQDVADACNANARLKQVVVDWLAATPHQTLGTREWREVHGFSRTDRYLREQLAKEAEITRILNSAQLIDNAQAKREADELDHKTPAATSRGAPGRL